MAALAQRRRPACMYVCIGNEQQNTGVHICALSLVFIRLSFFQKTMHMLLIYCDFFLQIGCLKRNTLVITPARIHSVSELKSRVFDICGLKMMKNGGLEFFILKFIEPLQCCCCPVPKNLAKKAELAWQVSRYA